MQDFVRSLTLIPVPPAERAIAIKGAGIFFDRGWPSNHFTVDMAVRAGKGLVPPLYDGIGSEERYFQTTQSPADHRVAETAPTSPAELKAPSGRGNPLVIR